MAHSRPPLAPAHTTIALRAPQAIGRLRPGLPLAVASGSPERSTTIAKAVPVETICGGSRGSRSSSSSPASRATVDRSNSSPNSGSRCLISPNSPSPINRTGTRPTFSASVTVESCAVSGACVRKTLAVPSVGCPAKFNSSRVVKMRTRTPSARSTSIRSPLHERRLRQVELARDRLHLLGRQSRRVHHHRQRIALERRLRKNVCDKVFQFQGLQLPPFNRRFLSPEYPSAQSARRESRTHVEPTGRSGFCLPCLAPPGEHPL